MLAENWLARVAGEGLGNVRGATAEEMVTEVLAMAPSDVSAIHIFQRDQALPGTRGFEPGLSELSQVIGEVFSKSLQAARKTVPLINVPCAVGCKVLDVILVEPDQWLIGTHQFIRWTKLAGRSLPCGGSRGDGQSSVSEIA